MSNVIMTPRYDTKLFSEIWDDAAEFKADYNASPFKGAISSTESATTKDNVSLLYYLLYAKYGIVLLSGVLGPTERSYEKLWIQWIPAWCVASFP